MQPFKDLHDVETFLHNHKGSMLGEALQDMWHIIVQQGLGEHTSVNMFAKFHTLASKILV